MGGCTLVTVLVFHFPGPTSLAVWFRTNMMILTQERILLFSESQIVRTGKIMTRNGL